MSLIANGAHSSVEILNTLPLVELAQGLDLSLSIWSRMAEETMVYSRLPWPNPNLSERYEQSQRVNISTITW